MNVAWAKETIFCAKQDMKIEPIETVDNLKYLGTDKKNKAMFLKKCSQRSYLLRKLSHLVVSQQFLELAYIKPSLRAL